MARVTTESWVAKHGYCLACDCDKLLPTAANTQARDFECEHCQHPYELKSAMRPFGRKIVDGAYASMMRRVEDGGVPTFLLMRYLQDTSVVHLSAIHHSLITPEVIEARKPLSATARRAGWIGCNILLTGIPPEGRITLFDDGKALPKSECRSIFQATANLDKKSIGDRGWAREMLRILHRLPKGTFSLEDVYRFERHFSEIFPNNRNIRPKIRQQLQVLRDTGLLVFVKPGWYRFAFTPTLNGGES